MTQETPSGWYPDPGQTSDGPATERWWDGKAWTDRIRPAEPAAAWGPPGQPPTAGGPPTHPAAADGPAPAGDSGSADGSAPATGSAAADRPPGGCEQAPGDIPGNCDTRTVSHEDFGHPAVGRGR